MASIDKSTLLDLIVWKRMSISYGKALRVVKLTIRDAHEGLRAAIETVLVGSAWQRCVLGTHNILSQVPKSSHK